MKKMLSMFFMMLLTIVVLGACGESDIKKTDSAKEKQETKKETKKEEKKDETQQLKVGESATIDGVKVTLNSVRIEKGGEFDTPQKGQFLVVNLTAENTTKEEQNVSSMANVELLDKDGYKYTTTILTEGTQGQFDGAIPASGKLRGEIPFDVPTSDSFELHYSIPFKSGKAIWKIAASDLQK